MPEAKQCITGGLYIVIRSVGSWSMRLFSAVFGVLTGSRARFGGGFFRKGV